MNEFKITRKNNKTLTKNAIRNIDKISSSGENKIYGQEVETKSIKLIPFYTNESTHKKLLNHAYEQKMKGNTDEDDMCKIIQKSFNKYFDSLPEKTSQTEKIEKNTKKRISFYTDEPTHKKLLNHAHEQKMKGNNTNNTMSKIIQSVVELFFK